MKKIKTANTPKHNFDKEFNRYVRTNSKRSLEAVMRTKRLDAGFFFLEFYPMLRDFFLETHKKLDEKDFEVILQLHANQPFCTEDLYECITRVNKSRDWEQERKLSMGRRAARNFLDRFEAQGLIKLFKNRGRYNKKLYLFADNLNSDIERLYKNMLCLTKLRTTDATEMPQNAKKSRSHYRKALKQNRYKDAFDNTSIKMKNEEVTVLLREARLPKADIS